MPQPGLLLPCYRREAGNPPFGCPYNDAVSPPAIHGISDITGDARVASSDH